MNKKERKEKKIKEKLKKTNKLEEDQIGVKTIKKMQNRFQQLQKKRKKKKQEFIKRTEEEEDRLNFVGFALSRKFKYVKLMKSANPEKAQAEGREVHGFMQRMFPDYEWLIDNDVLDRACYFASQEYQAEIYNLIDKYDFENMKQNLVLIPKKTHFDHYPELEFERMVFYSEEPLRKQLTWIKDYDWTTEDFYKTTVKYGPCNILNMGSPLYDLPVFVVTWSLGKNDLFFKAKTTAEDLTRERDELIRNQIFKLRDKEKNMEDLIDELKIENEGIQGKYDNLKYKMLARDPSTTDEKFTQWEKNYSKKQGININLKKVLWGILIFAIIALVILVIWLVIARFSAPTSSIPETANIFLHRFSGWGW